MLFRSDAKPPLLHAAKSRHQEYVERNTAPPKGRQHTPTPHLQTLPSDPNVLSVASRKVTVHGAPPTPDPHRILGFHPDMGRSGEMVSSAAPQGGKRRQKAASPPLASQGGQGFPRTPICSTRTHRRWIRQDPNRTGDWEGMHGRERGNTSRSGTPTARRPHGRTHRHAARHQMRRTRSMMASLSAAPTLPTRERRKQRRRRARGRRPGLPAPGQTYPPPDAGLRPGPKTCGARRGCPATAVRRVGFARRPPPAVAGGAREKRGAGAAAARSPEPPPRERRERLGGTSVFCSKPYNDEQRK